MQEPDGSITISPTLSLHKPTQNTAQVSGSETSSTFASDSASLPGIIIEVAYRNESWPALLEEVDVWSRSGTKWHKADVVVAIAIRPNTDEASDPFAVVVASCDDGPPIVGSGSPVVLPSTFSTLDRTMSFHSRWMRSLDFRIATVFPIPRSPSYVPFFRLENSSSILISRELNGPSM